MDGRVAAVGSLKIKSIPFHRARIKHNRRGERMLLSTLLLVIMICPLRFTYAEKLPVEPDDHEIDEAVYSEPTPNQEVVSCGNIETPFTDPVSRKRGRPFKNKGPMKKEKGKLFKRRIISGVASSPPIPATSSAPSTDSGRMQLSTISESLSIIRRNPKSLRTKKQLTVALGVSGANHGKATGFQSQKHVQGGSAEKPLENRADEVQASATGFEQLADTAMAEKPNGTLNNAYPGSSDIPANEPGSSEAVDVSISPQYHDLYRKISACYGRYWIGKFQCWILPT